MLKKSFFLLFLLLFSTSALAQTEAVEENIEEIVPEISYPERPIKFLVGAEPGSVADITARYVATKLTEEWGQQILVENPLGKGGSVVMHMLLALKPDGYTIAMTDLNPFGANVYAFNVNYRLNHISPLEILYTSPMAVIATRENNWFKIEDVFEPAKESGRRVRVAFTNNAALNAFEYLSLYEDVEIFPVEQETEEDVFRMLEEGYADIAMVGVEGFEGTLEGRFKTLASTGHTRFPSLPYAYTLKEQGYKRAVYDQPLIVSVPARTPDDVKQKISDALINITSSEEYLILLNQLQLTPTMQGKQAAAQLATHSLNQARNINKAKDEGLESLED